MNTLLKINPTRFKADFETLAAIGSTGDGGVHRPALGETHLAARRWYADTIQKAGLELRVDSVGNHSAYLACGEGPESPTLLLGSHLDSVPHGGRFDGALGVTAALEALRTVKEAGLRLPVHLEAIDFTDEEGTLVGLLGSSALAGHLTEADLIKPRGGRDYLLDSLARAGLTEHGLLAARRDPADLAGYLELHIEQGPHLVKAGIKIGIVSEIVGIASYRLAFLGRADHAGTTPMSDRKDASQGAAAFILNVRQIVLNEFPDCVANVGYAQLEPGAFNIVPARASLSLECRAPLPDLLAALEKRLLDQAASDAARFRLELDIQFLNRHPPAPMSRQAQQAIAQAAEQFGLSHISLPSGAGHDAQSLAPLCAAGMIFVPSVDGASHSPIEFTPFEDCVNGANVLLNSCIQLANLKR